MNEFELGMEGRGLSRAGERRREEILASLRCAMTTHRRRKRALRATGSLAAVLLVAGAAVFVSLRAGRTNGTSASGVVADNSAGATKEGRAPSAFTLVRNDPGIIQRVAVGYGEAVTSIDDDELARLLDEAGRPSGMVRTRGRVYLDADMAQEDDGSATGT